MFKRRTLFIVGAGASTEVDFPVGAKLAQQIREKLDVRYSDDGRQIAGDRDLYRDICAKLPRPNNALQRAAWLIRNGLQFSYSIDDFLDQHQGNEEVKIYGKAAIVKCILEAERQSPLCFNRHRSQPTIDPDKLESTWYAKFMKMLGRGTKRENAKEIFGNVAFIVFNYDRCIEQFLRHGVQRLYGIGEEEAQDICSDLRIIHPYGSVAELPMHGVSGGVPFGDHNHGSDHIGLAENIKTYTEQILDAGMNSAIATEVLSADNIVFLGFAFHEPNMLLLTPENKLKPKTIFGTAFNVSDDDVVTVRRQIVSMFEDASYAGALERIKINNKLTCSDLFDFYARSLAA